MIGALRPPEGSKGEEELGGEEQRKRKKDYVCGNMAIQLGLSKVCIPRFIGTRLTDLVLHLRKQRFGRVDGVWAYISWRTRGRAT